MQPFWPRKSPHFLECRRGVRAAQLPNIVCVGLSGGADSLALTAALVAEGHDVIAICIDHGLQAGSREQAEHAAAQARAWGARAEVISIDVDGENTEAAARRARYGTFALTEKRILADLGVPVTAKGAGETPRVGKKEGEGPAVGDKEEPRGEKGEDESLGEGRMPFAVGHTADDQAETLILSAMRGKVSGMAPSVEIEGAWVVRPLLQVRRADTEAACEELGVEPWQDPHNEDEGFRRVAVRKRVLPLLSEIAGGDVTGALAQAADDVVADEGELEAPISNDCAELAALAEPRRRRAIAGWLREHGVEVTREVLGGIGKLCTDWHGQGGVAVRVPGARRRLEVVRVGGKLALLSGH